MIVIGRGQQRFNSCKLFCSSDLLFCKERKTITPQGLHKSGMPIYSMTLLNISVNEHGWQSPASLVYYWPVSKTSYESYDYAC